jgi:hypothetical protein
MRYKSVLVGGIILLLFSGGAFAVLYALLRHEPNFYRQSAVPPGAARQQQSKAFETQAFDLYREINNDLDWQAKFTEMQVNSWLAEDFIRSNLAQQLPAGVSEPRIAFRPGRVLLAFRYGDGTWDTVVSVEAKVWVPKQEPNVVALQIEDLRAGAMPIAVKVLQDELTEGARQQNIDVQWYRHEGKPVAILRFQADRREPSLQLDELEVGDGYLFVKGRSVDPDAPRRIAEYPLDLRPAP